MRSVCTIEIHVTANNIKAFDCCIKKKYFMANVCRDEQ